MAFHLLILIWLFLPKFSNHQDFCNFICGETNFALCDMFTDLSDDIWEIVNLKKSLDPFACEITSANVEINQGVTIYQKFLNFNESTCTSGEIRTRLDNYGPGRWCIDVSISINPIGVIRIFRTNHLWKGVEFGVEFLGNTSQLNAYSIKNENMVKEIYNFSIVNGRYYICINLEISYIGFFLDGEMFANISNNVPDPNQSELGFFIKNFVIDWQTEAGIFSESYVKIHWMGFPLNSNLRKICSVMISP